MEPDIDGLRRRLAELARYRHEHLRGDEKGEAQIFCEALFRAFGHAGVRQAGATLEQRIKKRDVKGTAFADLMYKPHCLIEMKKAGADLSRHYRQAFDYWVQAVRKSTAGSRRSRDRARALTNSSSLSVNSTSPTRATRAYVGSSTS